MARLPTASPWPSSHWNHLSPAQPPFPAPPALRPALHPSTPNPPHASPTAPRAPAASVPGPLTPFPASFPLPPSPKRVSNHFPFSYRPRAPHRKRSSSPACSFQTPTHDSPTCAWLLSHPILGNEYASETAPTQRRRMADDVPVVAI